MQYNKVKVEVVATKTSLAFYNRKDVESSGVRVWSDEDEWNVSLSLIINLSGTTHTSHRAHTGSVTQSYT